MEMVLSSGFCEMTELETQSTNGGLVIAVVAIGAATIEITGGMVLSAIGTAWGIGTVACEIYNAFK